MRRHRDRKRAISSDVTSDKISDVTVTVQNRTETEAETESEQKEIAAAPPPKVSRQKQKRSIPDGFEIAHPNVTYAKSLGFSDFEIKREHQKFCMSAKANARTYSDWNAAEHNWITKAAEFAGKRPRGEWDVPDDGLIEVLDQRALEAWDEYGVKTNGKTYPRNKKGGWRHPTKFPPGYEDRMIADVQEIVSKSMGAL
jgi:hypothetical protein